MKNLTRRLLFLGLVLALFNVQAFAQIRLVIHTPASNISQVAQRLNGVVVDELAGVDEFLLDVPVVPQNLPDNNVLWWEVNEAKTLPSEPRPAYLRVTQSTSQSTAAADCYKTQPAFVLTNLSGALTRSTGQGRGVVVAVIDSGVDSLHPCLIGHTIVGPDFVAQQHDGLTSLHDSSASYLDDSSASYLDQATITYLNDSSASYLDDSSASYLDGGNPARNHGTLTAAIVHNIAPESMILTIRAFDDVGGSDCFMIAKAIRYAANNAQVINMSFGNVAECAVVRSAIAYALQRNTILVASAGNGNCECWQYPAANPGVMATAATDLTDRKASFSNYGAWVYIAAPGVNIISAVRFDPAFPDRRFAIVSGTSFSAPFTAGAAALVLADGVAATGVKAKIATGATNINLQNPNFVNQLGFGRIDLLRTLN